MKTLKPYLRLFVTGVVIAVLIAIIMLKVTMNFQLLLFIGGILFFTGGLYNGKTIVNKVVAAVIISIPYSVLFMLLVLPQLPKIYYFIPIFIVACLLGLYWKMEQRKVIISIFALTCVTLFLAIKIIPLHIESSLTQLKSEPLPEISLTDLDGNTYTANQLKGNVLILDFFGTWCAPCRKELPELQKVKDAFQDRDDILFYVINADIGGDTQEKFEKFINDHPYNFTYVYDSRSLIYKELNLETSGLPTLLVVDKDNLIRMHHVGYNEAEVHFTENLIELINDLVD